MITGMDITADQRIQVRDVMIAERDDTGRPIDDRNYAAAMVEMCDRGDPKAAQSTADRWNELFGG